MGKIKQFFKLSLITPVTRKIES